MGKSEKVGKKEAVLNVNAENTSPTISWSIPQLKEYLRSRGGQLSGRKADLSKGERLLRDVNTSRPLQESSIRETVACDTQNPQASSFSERPRRSRITVKRSSSSSDSEDFLPDPGQIRRPRSSEAADFMLSTFSTEG